jgi:hypothetical protein
MTGGPGFAFKEHCFLSGYPGAASMLRFAKKLRKLKQQGKIRKYVPRDLIKKP